MSAFGYRAARAIRARLIASNYDWSVLCKSWRRKWMVQRILATPPWVNMADIKKFYVEAARLTAETGVHWTVGHQIPLNHPYVCGLHVPYNLKLEPATVNFSKGNSYHPDQLQLKHREPIQHGLSL
jgi:hypothetical protein